MIVSTLKRFVETARKSVFVIFHLQKMVPQAPCVFLPLRATAYHAQRIRFIVFTCTTICRLLRTMIPREGPGGKVENVSSVSPACRKRRLIGAVCRNHRIKRSVPCRCLVGRVKEPYEMSMALGARP